MFASITVEFMQIFPYIDIPVVLLFLHFLVLWDCRVQHLFGNIVAVSPGLASMRDVTSAVISSALGLMML